MQEPKVTSDEELREQAVARLKKQSDFRADLLAYVLVNTFLVVIWALTGVHFFWPAFPILGWGIGLFFHAREAYWERPISEEQIRREMQHLR